MKHFFTRDYREWGIPRSFVTLSFGAVAAGSELSGLSQRQIHSRVCLRGANATGLILRVYYSHSN